MLNIESERGQLIDTWKSVFLSKWLSRPRSSVRGLTNLLNSEVGMHFRQTHNVFGWMAGNVLEKRGLCSGAIYRTEKFIEVAQEARNGSAGPRRSLVHLQNVHIEHTVPIAELNTRWLLYRAERQISVAEAYAWMLVHSVTTAFHMSEKGGLGRFESKSPVFEMSSSWFDRPFMRYTVAAKQPVVWNVLTGKKINAEQWSFQDHFSMIDKLFDLANCNPDEAGLVRKAAASLLPIEPTPSTSY